MNKEEFLRLFEEVVEAEPGTLSGDEELLCLAGWDSIATVGFLAMVDEHFQMAVDAESISQCKTPNGLTRLLGNKVAA